MRFFYGLGDEKYILYNTERKKKPNPLDSFCFKDPSIVLRGLDKWKRNEPSITFRATPDTLVQLCLNVIDKFPLPNTFEWDIDDVCRWIKKFGYPYYMHTFRVNMINGRTLLLVDASALSAMNIKDFDEIQHITSGIRKLFFFEVAKFARSISLPQNDLKELFKLFRVKTGLYYTDKMRSHYWRLMKFIREKSPNRTHWERLERWLRLIPEREFPEAFGGMHRFNQYACKLPPPASNKSIFTKEFDYENAPMIYNVVKKGYNKCKRLTTKHIKHLKDCTCDIPCECYYKREEYKEKWRLACLVKNDKKCTCFLPCYCPASSRKRVSIVGKEEERVCKCCPPCECHWSAHEYEYPRILSIIQREIPEKYCHNFTIQQEHPFVCQKKKPYPKEEEDPPLDRTILPWKYCGTWYRRLQKGYPCKKVYRDYWWSDACNEISEEHIPEEAAPEEKTIPKPKKKKIDCNRDSST